VRFLPLFGKRNWAFFQKPMSMLAKTSSSLRENAIFFAKLFGENILKSDWANFRLKGHCFLDI
jgi:hypothetical protein